MRIDTQTGDVNFDSKISCHEGAIVNINRPANIFNPALTIQNDNAGTQGYAMIKCARTDGNNGIKSVAFGMNALGNNNYGGEDTLILGSFLHDVNISLVTSNATRLLIQKTTGHVGVGTTSPSCKLHVNGPVRIGTYAADNLPSASECGLGAIICISNYDEGSGPSARLALSNGSDWQALS